MRGTANTTEVDVSTSEQTTSSLRAVQVDSLEAEPLFTVDQTDLDEYSTKFEVVRELRQIMRSPLL